MLSSNLTKEDVAGFVLNPDVEVQTLPGPWWVPSGLQPPHQHLNTISTCLSQLGDSQDQQKSAGNVSGDKTSPEEEMDSQNHQGNTTNSSPGTHEQNAYFQIRLGQPMVSMSQSEQLYGPFSVYGPQPMGSVMVPMSLEMDDGTVYVNPKQYHRILCRRKIRAKAALKLQARQSKSKDKPYVHESRHLHALRRPRGAGGRFLTSKELQNLNYTAGNDKSPLTNKTSPRQQFSNPSRSSSSEVLQGETGNFSSPTSKGANLNRYGSEVTSVLYNGKQLDWFHHQIPSSVMVEEDHGCFDFLKV